MKSAARPRPRCCGSPWRPGPARPGGRSAPRTEPRSRTREPRPSGTPRPGLGPPDPPRLGGPQGAPGCTSRLPVLDFCATGDGQVDGCARARAGSEGRAGLCPETDGEGRWRTGPRGPYPGRLLEAPQGRGGAGSPRTRFRGVGGHLRLVPTDTARPRTGCHPPPSALTTRLLLPDPLTQLPPGLAWPPAMITDAPIQGPAPHSRKLPLWSGASNHQTGAVAPNPCSIIWEPKTQSKRASFSLGLWPWAE